MAAALPPPRRYAVYYAPRPGAFAEATARWLGWDAGAGQPVPQPELAAVQLAEVTAAPRTYGFHGTLRAPFRPGDGVTPGQIADCVAALAALQAPVTCAGLEFADLQGFVALVPVEPSAGLAALAAAVVRATDPLRAPLTAADLARRKPNLLSPTQRALLQRWGYPHVMEAFQFHLTLTGPVPPHQIVAVLAAVEIWIGPTLPKPFVIEDLCLFGQDGGGPFRLLQRFALMGQG